MSSKLINVIIGPVWKLCLVCFLVIELLSFSGSMFFVEGWQSLSVPFYFVAALPIISTRLCFQRAARQPNSIVQVSEGHAGLAAWHAKDPSHEARFTSIGNPPLHQPHGVTAMYETRETKWTNCFLALVCSLNWATLCLSGQWGEWGGSRLASKHRAKVFFAHLNSFLKRPVQSSSNHPAVYLRFIPLVLKWETTGLSSRTHWIAITTDHQYI